MKKLLVLLFCLVVASAACGDDTTSDPSDEPDATAPDTDRPDTDGPDGDGDDPTAPGDGPLGGGSYPVGEVAFVVTNPDGTTQEYAVSCLGDTATVFGDIDTSGDTIGDITGDRLCRALADSAVRTRLVEGEPADQVCTEIFGSEHTADVSGTLDGVSFTARFHRANGCGIDDWDVLLADLLPPV